MNIKLMCRYPLWVLEMEQRETNLQALTGNISSGSTFHFQGHVSPCTKLTGLHVRICTSRPNMTPYCTKRKGGALFRRMN